MHLFDYYIFLWEMSYYICWKLLNMCDCYILKRECLYNCVWFSTFVGNHCDGGCNNICRTAMQTYASQLPHPHFSHSHTQTRTQSNVCLPYAGRIFI